MALAVGGAGFAARTSDALAQAAEETPRDVIAIQIRRQGFVCEKPISAERDQHRSKPDEPVWVLKCEGHSYRVRLVPDMAADVQRLD